MCRKPVLPLKARIRCIRDAAFIIDDGVSIQGRFDHLKWLRSGEPSSPKGVSIHGGIYSDILLGKSNVVGAVLSVTVAEVDAIASRESFIREKFGLTLGGKMIGLFVALRYDDGV